MEPNALSRRIEQLAVLSAEEPDREHAAGDPALLVGVGTVLAQLRSELGALRGELGSVRTDIDAMSGRLTGSVTAGRTETGTLARRVSDLANRVDVVGTRVDDVRSDLPSIAREVREALELLPLKAGAKLDELTGALGASFGTRLEAVAAEVRRTVGAALEREADGAAATQAHLIEARGSLESRLAVLEDALVSLAEKLESSARDAAHTTRSQLHGLAATVTAIEARLEAVAGEQVERIVARLREVTEVRLEVLSTSLIDATRGRNEALRRELLEVLTRASAEQEATRNQVAVLVDTVRHAGTQQADATLAQDRRVAVSLAEVREEISTELDDVAERLLVSVTGLQEREARRATADAARTEVLQRELGGTALALRTELSAALAGVRADAREQIASLHPRLDELAAVAAAATVSETAGRVQLAQLLEAVRDGMSSVVSDATGVVHTALEQSTRALAESSRTTHEALLDRLAEQQGALLNRLADLAAASSGSTAATRETGERLAALASAQDDVRRTVLTLEGDWPRRAGEATTAARAAAEEVVADLRSEIRTQLDAVITEVTRAAGTVDEARTVLVGTVERIDEAATLQREGLAKVAAQAFEQQADLVAAAAEAAARAQRPAALPEVPRERPVPQVLTAQAEPATVDGERRGAATAVTSSPPAGQQAPEQPAPAKAVPAKREPAKPAAGSAAAGSGAAGSAAAGSAAPAKPEPGSAAPAKPEPGSVAPAKPERASAAPGTAVPVKRAPARSVRGKAVPAQPRLAKTGPPKAGLPKTGPSPKVPAKAAPSKAAAKAAPSKAAAKAVPSKAAPGKAGPAQERPAKEAAVPLTAAPPTQASESLVVPPPAPRRGRLDAMPEVPSPKAALDAATARPWALDASPGTEAAAPVADEPRRMFRRRRS